MGPLQKLHPHPPPPPPLTEAHETVFFVGDPFDSNRREFPKIRGTLFWGPYNKDPTSLGAILESPFFGNSLNPKPFIEPL